MSVEIPIVLNPAALLLEIDQCHQPMVNKATTLVEAWLNFAALKANWYGDEKRILQFKFRLHSPQSFARQVAVSAQSHWLTVTQGQSVYLHDDKTLTTLVLLAFESKDLADFENQLKAQSLQICDQVAKCYGFQSLVK